MENNLVSKIFWERPDPENDWTKIGSVKKGKIEIIRGKANDKELIISFLKLDF